MTYLYHENTIHANGMGHKEVSHRHVSVNRLFSLLRRDHVPINSISSLFS
jgi:hypothetical protein